MSLPKVIVLGAGGHSKVVMDAIGSSATILGVTDFPSENRRTHFFGVPVLGDDSVITAWSSEDIFLVNGIGSIRVGPRRIDIFNRFKKMGYPFLNVIHSSAILGSEVMIAEGVQIFAGCVVQAGTRIGSNTIVNTGAKVDHDCVIGDHVHVAPGVTISGGVSIGSQAHIGVGATVIQGVQIGNGATIGAGAVVLKDVLPGSTVVGVPAKKR